MTSMRHITLSKTNIILRGEINGNWFGVRGLLNEKKKIVEEIKDLSYCLVFQEKC